MYPQRLAVKLFSDTAPSAVDLEAAIALFHDLIREEAVEGLLLDVADYRHVPNGPGVVLIGHDVDYGVDLVGGRTGLYVVRKRTNREIPLDDLLRDTLRKTLSAAEAIAKRSTALPAFSHEDFEVQVLDRVVAQNDDAGHSAVESAIAPVLAEVYGDAKLEISRGNAADTRAPVAAAVSASGAADRSTLISRLPAPAPRAAGGPAKIITVERLAELRKDGGNFRLIDVRETNEYEAGNIGGELIPLGTLDAKLPELPKDEHYVVHCQSGGRSAKAVATMRAAGFERVTDVEGGYAAWAERVDS